MSATEDRSNRRFTVYSACIGGGFWLVLVAALAAFRHTLPPLTDIAPLLALALAGEELVVRQQARPGGAVLSFSAVAHIAAAILLGPLAAACVAAFAVVIVDGLRPAGRRFVLINSAMLGGSIWIAGACYQLAGGGKTLAGLGSLPPLLVLVSSRYLLTTLVFVAGATISSGRRFGELFPQVALEDLGSAVGEGSLGILVAFGLATSQSWIILPLLAPLLAALYQSKATLQQLEDETGRVLESFAHVVDARDPSTSEHTQRVAAQVDRFLRLVDIPDRKRERLVSAAKVHDLGKIAVDVATLSKAGRLTPAELDTIRRHARLSAFLLRPFTFARQMAVYVELHHERYDGRGYYEVPAAEIPIEAHVLVVADSYDAMTSERAYRPALTVEEASRELLDKAGTQFHPLVAPAFAAMMLEQPLEQALTAEELAALRRSFAAVPLLMTPFRRGLPDARGLMLVFAVAALILVGVGPVPGAVPLACAAAACAAGLRWLATLAGARRRERRMLDRLIAGERPAGALAAAGISGWLAWLQGDDARARYTPVEADAVTGVSSEVLAEACRWAARRESSAELRLASGGWLLLRDFDRNGCRLAIGLERPPSEVERQLVEALVARLRPPERSGPELVAAPAERRAAVPSRRAVFLVDLAAFETIRVEAGQLVAQHVVDEVERRLLQLLRSADSLTRIGDDKFGIAVLVPDEQSLAAVRERIVMLLEAVPVPHRISRLSPHIVGAFGKEIEQTPELVALDQKLSPHACAWVAAS